MLNAAVEILESWEKFAGTQIVLVIGDKVRVRQAVVKPSQGWAGVTHASVGILRRIYSSGFAIIDFPEYIGWQGILDEMERVQC